MATGRCLELAQVRGPHAYNLQPPGGFKLVDRAKLELRHNRLHRRISRELFSRGIDDKHDISNRRFEEVFGKLIAARKKIQKRRSVADAT